MKYEIILADCPWSYKDKASAGKRGASHKYEVQGLNWIKSLEVNKLAADNCCLFLWITMPQLPNAFEVIKEWGFCCVPETKVLMADLSWKDVGDLKVGEVVLGFDEHPDKNKRRYYKRSVVEGTGRLVLPCYKITFENGEDIICSDEHEWLCRYRQPCGQTGVIRWRKTKDLLNDYNGRVGSTVEIIKLANVKSPLSSYEAGFVAGAFDSEGSLNSIKPRLCFSQKVNPLLEKVLKYLDSFNYKYNQHFYKDSTLCNLDIHGGIMRVMDFLQEFRPPRLLKNWSILKFKKSSLYNLKGNTVKKVEFVGDKEVIALQTSSRTYIAEGYASHNTYKTCAFTWVKTNKKSGSLFWGMGNWTRSNPELCLLATKGKPKRMSASVHSVVQSAISKHSEKPMVVHDLIVELCGDLKRVELFARKAADGWDVLGNEIDQQDLKTVLENYNG